MPSETTLSDPRGGLASPHAKGLTGFALLILTVVALTAAACSHSNSAPPVSVTPSGVGSGAHVGGWITSTYTVAEAHKDVDQYFGMTTQLPRNVPPSLALKAISIIPVPNSVLQRETLDYYPKAFVPPTAAGQSIPANESHIQVEAFSHEGEETGRTPTVLDLGTTGYTITRESLSPTEQQAAGGGTAGLYTISGHGRSWSVEVWPSSPPSQADMMAFLKGIPPQ